MPCQCHTGLGRLEARALLVLTGALLGAGLVTLAGPMVPARHEMPGEVRSLAELAEVRLDVRPVADLIRADGTEEDDIRSQLSEALRGAGIEVVDDADAPALALLVLAVDEPKVPGGVGYCLLLEVAQEVRIERLAESMPTPTFTSVRLGLEPRGDLRPAIREDLRRLVDRFIHAWRTATARRRG